MSKELDISEEEEGGVLLQGESSSYLDQMRAQIRKLEQSMNRVETQLHTFSGLQALKESAPQLLKLHSNVLDIQKNTRMTNYKTETSNTKISEFKEGLDSKLTDLTEAFREECQMKSAELKGIKKRSEDLGKRIQRIDLESDLKMQEMDVKFTTDMVGMASEITHHTEAQKKYLMHLLYQTDKQRAADYAGYKEHVLEVQKKVNKSSTDFDKRITEVERNIPNVKKGNNMTMDDLKMWLIAEMDSRMAENMTQIKGLIGDKVRVQNVKIEKQLKLMRGEIDEMKEGIGKLEKKGILAKGGVQELTGKDANLLTNEQKIVVMIDEGMKLVEEYQDSAVKASEQCGEEVDQLEIVVNNYFALLPPKIKKNRQSTNEETVKTFRDDVNQFVRVNKEKVNEFRNDISNRQNKLTVDTYKIDSKISYIEQLKRDIQRVQKKKVSQHDIAKIEMIKDDKELQSKQFGRSVNYILKKLDKTEQKLATTSEIIEKDFPKPQESQKQIMD